MIFLNAPVLLVFLGHELQVESYWTKGLLGAAVIALLCTILPLTILFLQALFVPRQLVSLSDKEQVEPTTFLGKPLFFPVQFNHIRLRPVKDQFMNRFLLVGTPVGLRCRIGSLLAVDDDSLDVTPPPGGVGKYWSWSRLSSQLSCWFTVDSARFLHRGDHGLDLRTKLDNFLRDQNEDPAQWPYAYLLGVPQFLGWSRAVVSWWYLYNENREIDAMIFEINNSYYEKRNIFLRVKSTSGDLVAPPPDLPMEYLDQLQLARSLISLPRTKFYQGTWIKSVFASPFEKVDGLVSNRMMDPLHPAAWKSKTSFSNMITMEEDTGEVRMATRMICDGPPIDPTKMTTFEVAKFLTQWTLPNIFTTAEIVIKALKIKFYGIMVMNKKPPVRSGSVGQPITKLESDFERVFRSYLTACVRACPEPIELTYLPCRSFTNEIVRMQSSSYEASHKCVLTLTVEPADPRFYSRFPTYQDVSIALAQETTPAGLAADPTAPPLIVSDLSLLTSILESLSKMKHQANGSSWKTKLLFSWCRNSAPTFVDRFALSMSDRSARAAYLSSTLEIANARKLAFGSQTLLGIWKLISSCLMRWLFLEGLSAWCSTFSFVGKSHVVMVVSGYIFAVSVWERTKVWFLQS